MSNIGYGWKFTDPDGITRYPGATLFQYNTQLQEDGWCGWTNHPQPSKYRSTDIRATTACGPGRLHVMNRLSSIYAPDKWKVWYVQYYMDDVVAIDQEKTGVTRLRLRPVPARALFRYISLLPQEDPYSPSACKLDRWKHTGENLNGVKVQRIHLKEFSLVSSTMKQATFNASILVLPRFINADLSGVSIAGTGIHSGTFTSVTMQGANVYSSRLENCIISDSGIWESSFYSAVIYNSSISRCDLSRSKFAHSVINGTTFYRAGMHGVDFGYSDLTGTKFELCDMSNANLSGCNMTAVAFYGCNMEGAKVQPAQLPCIPTEYHKRLVISN